MWHSGSELSCYKRLILAVVNQAIQELHTTGQSPQRLLHKDWAEQWLFENECGTKRLSVGWCALMLDVPLRKLRQAAREGRYLLNVRNEAKRERQVLLDNEETTAWVGEGRQAR